MNLNRNHEAAAADRLGSTGVPPVLPGVPPGKSGTRGLRARVGAEFSVDDSAGRRAGQAGRLCYPARCARGSAIASQLVRFAVCLVFALSFEAHAQLEFKVEGGNLRVLPAPRLPSSAETGKAAPPPATLRWQNGETITGEIVEATTAALTWKSPFFADPLVLAWPALRRVEQSLTAIAPVDSFGFVLRDGSYLYGDPVSISADAIAVHSTRHGDFMLKRAEVLRMQRIQAGGTVMAGPNGDYGWKNVAERKNSSSRRFVFQSRTVDQPQLVAGPGGALSLPYWNSGAYLDKPLPELVEVAFRLRSTKRPEFQMALEGGSKLQVRLETWDEDLVLAAGEQFKTIRSLSADEREVSLRLCWDRKASQCFVYSAAGALLADWTVPAEPGAGNTGLVLLNKGRDLAVESLIVREWSGKPPATLDPKQPRVELADGRVLMGKITASPDGGIIVQGKGESAEQSAALIEIDAVVFSEESPKVKEAEATLAYADGALLFGRVQGIKEGRATLGVAFVGEPLAAATAGLRRLLVKVPPAAGAPAELPKAELDQLTLKDNVWRGKLVNNGGPTPQWLPVGGARPAALLEKTAFEIRRAFSPDGNIAGADALFFTNSGDVLPGNLRSLDRTTVELDSPITEMKKLLPTDLEAIQFGSAGRLSLKGFTDPGWRVLKGDDTKVTRSKEKLTMEPETTLLHPLAMQASEIKFKLNTENFCTIRLGLYCQGSDGTKGTSLAVMRNGDRIYIGLDGGEGQFMEQTQLRVGSQPVTVKLVPKEKQVEVYVNEVMLRSFPIDAAKRAGSGLVIEPGSMWGGSVQAIELVEFSAVSQPGLSPLPDINNETRTQTLIVPRFRKDDAPRHVLLAGNGDLLRGEIEAITATHFGFRSGLEQLRVPRDRVKAVIWLKKPEAAEGAEPAPPPVPAALTRKIDGRFNFRSGVNLQTCISILEQQSGGVHIKLSAPADERRQVLQFGNQTVAEVLEQICAKFGLRYRMDGSATVILEPALRAPAGMEERVYWLKPDAFPATPPVQETLAAKGVEFPAGASVAWHAGLRQLTSINTAANQAKLAETLTAEFGALPDSPTHWFLLSNGGRLGLAVEKFEKDFIHGRHPIYGACTLPVDQVVTIRTTRLEPAASAKAFADWRLTYAKEPVLPEAGGSASPTLGKDAPAFKLPLLSGGDFELVQEKGKVVVLDFWATWCGPCIQSLPGNIESFAAFPADRFRFIGVNQGEPGEQVKRFLETRKWELTVALDSNQNVGRQYGVDGIPYMVIIGADGKVAWTKTGYSAEAHEEAVAEVKKLLGL